MAESAQNSTDSDRRLILVTNREPYKEIERNGQKTLELTTGGLVTALDSVLKQRGGIWIAWGEGNAKSAPVLVPPQSPRYAVHHVVLTRAEIKNYYLGLANSALWPLCHNFVAHAKFDRNQWEDYYTVNQKFVDTVAEIADEGDLVWFQDYHLGFAPRMLRQVRPDLRSAIFWHIPFPPAEIFRIFPWRDEIINGMLGADLVGFHTRAYAQNFLDSVRSRLGCRIYRRQRLGNGRYALVDMVREERKVRVAAFPIGIDVGEFENIARSPQAQASASRIRRQFGGESIVLGVDRLDYTKGILERLLAIERLFERYPDLRRRVVFIQVAVPSRTKVEEYRRMRRDIEQAIGRINGRFAEEGWEPVRYFCRSLPRHKVVAYYLAADVALITPLKDGLNLVAKEYVASHVDGDGVLILSEFAGAAAELDDALFVNPYNIEEVTTRIRQAVDMPIEERRRRMGRLRETVRHGDIANWVANILAAVEPDDIAETGEPTPIIKSEGTAEGAHEETAMQITPPASAAITALQPSHSERLGVSSLPR